MESLFNPEPPEGLPSQTDEMEDYELDFAPPASLGVPLWRRLLVNILERVAPEKLPPLDLTSRPVDVGMLVGDRVALPWFRTVFTNLGDVISPEILPPLELESRPVEVGELIADQLAHNWWSSLLASLRDRVAGDRQPPLHLTSKPVNVGDLTGALQLPLWSSVISTPKVFLPDAVRTATAAPQASRVASVPAKPLPPDPELLALERQLRRDLLRSRLREAFWVSLLAAEVVFLVAGLLSK